MTPSHSASSGIVSKGAGPAARHTLRVRRHVSVPPFTPFPEVSNTMATSASSGGSHVGYEDARHRDRGRTPAQWYCLLAGAALLLAGIVGFFVDSSFDTGSNIDGDALVGFEVNGFHNLVHIASGLLLLAASAKRKSA